MIPRREARLRRRVRVLQHRVELLELGQQRTLEGPALTLENLVKAYQDLRRQAVREVGLWVVPDLAEHATGVLAEGSFRALTQMTIDDDVTSGWELRRIR